MRQVALHSEDYPAHNEKQIKNRFTFNQFNTIDLALSYDNSTIYIKNINFLEYNYEQLNKIKTSYSNVTIYLYLFFLIDIELVGYIFNIVDCIYYKSNNILEQLKAIIPITKLKKIVVITFGTFDLYHIGHQRIFERAQEYGEKIIVGISSDELNEIKGKCSYQNLETRLNIITQNTLVNGVFIETSLELKNEYIKIHGGNILIMGDDWVGKFDWVDCLTVYLPRTPNISSTMLREKIYLQ